jgi:hypothetical protein
LRRRFLGSRRRRLWSAALLSILLVYLGAQAFLRPARGAPWLPALPPRVTPTQNVAVLEHAVEALSGRRVNVYCWSTADWSRRNGTWDSERLGPLTPWRSYTSPETRNVELAPDTCTELERLRGRPQPIWKSADRRAAAWAVQSITHESVHVTGMRDEAKAECYGMQHIAFVAPYLGLSPAEGRFLARVYWRDWYPTDKAPYSSRQCRNGGKLDLHPGSERWP